MSDLLKVTVEEVKALREETGMRMSEAKLMALANKQVALLDRAEEVLDYYGNTSLEVVVKLQNEVIRSLIHVYNPE
jgi:translation elongation factor EF-Ts